MRVPVHAIASVTLAGIATASHGGGHQCVDAFDTVRVCPPDEAVLMEADGDGYFRFEDGWLTVSVSSAAGVGHGGDPADVDFAETFLGRSIAGSDLNILGETRHVMGDAAVFEVAASRDDGMASYEIEIVSPEDTAYVALVDFEGAETTRDGFGELADYARRLRAGVTVDGVTLGTITAAKGFE